LRLVQSLPAAARSGSNRSNLLLTDIAIVPLQGIPSYLSHWRRRLALAPGEGIASGPLETQRERILIVEDDLLAASQMEAALSEAGFEIAGIVTTGEEALQLAQAQCLTLVVIDIRLAGDRDGIDTAIELFRSHGIRCIFATAYSDRDSHLRAEPAAPLGWLQKPYTMRSLTEMVHAAVSELRGPDD
jgi:two-component system, response regulator PdtaR